MNDALLIIIMLLISSVVASLMRQRAAKSDKNPSNIARGRGAENKYAAMCEEGKRSASYAADTRRSIAY